MAGENLRAAAPNWIGSKVDNLVLATVNAPYSRMIDARTLRDAMATCDMDAWLVHVATFFTDVERELVFRFSEDHGISGSSLARAYFTMKEATGEQNPDLETALAAMAVPTRQDSSGSRSAS